MSHNTSQDGTRHAGRKTSSGCLLFPIDHPAPSHCKHKSGITLLGLVKPAMLALLFATTHMEDQPHSPAERPTDDALIKRGLDEAEHEERVIDDATARRAAAQLHEGQATAMYSLASCGAVDQEALEVEISWGMRDPETDERMQRMYTHLGRYAAQHAGRGPVEGWYRLTGDEHTS